ncbi:TonB-dependent receptor [Vandammella animalimorsus]|uniref:TonB-dependent receptor n=1 Tax=Vandammella animalimorsus TaxID=2029117 RepID=UPI00325BB6F4
MPARRFAPCPLAVCLAFSFALPASAQQPAAPEEKETPSLPPVTVTARGVQEQAQDAPLSLALIDGLSAERRAFVSVEDSLHSVPGVEIHSGGSGNTYLWMRGTGSLSHTSLDDTSVGIRIDGASQGLVGLDRNLYDLRQIEVAKGPQGTLHGHQADAGAVHIQTNDPAPLFDAQAGAGVGSDRLRRTEAMLNAPLGERLFLRLSGMAQWQDDYIHNRRSGQPLNTLINQGLRAKLLWQRDARTDVMLTAYRDRRLNDVPLVIFPPHGGRPVFDAGSMPQTSLRQTSGVHLDIRRRWAGAQLHALTAWSQHRGRVQRSYVPLDNLPYLFERLRVPAPMQPMLGAFYDNPANNLQRIHDDIRMLEQDVRLSSLPGSAVQWVAGAYLQRRNRGFGYDARRGLLPLPAPMPPLNADVYNADLQRDYRIRTQALYGELTYPLTPRLKTISGLRLSHERMDYRAHWQPNPASPLAAGGDKVQQRRLRETTVTGRLGLALRLTAQWHAYALYSRGHKPGGFGDYATNIAYGQPDNPYRAGRIDALELGLKGGAADGRWGMSAALFRNAVRDDKISVALYPSFITEPFNVDTRSQGLELSGFARLGARWRANAAASFIDAEVTAVPAVRQNQTRTGNRVPQVPRASAALGLEYRQPLALPALGQGQFFARADLRHVGRRAAGPDNRLMLGGHTLADAAIGWSGRHLEWTLWGKNLGNRHWMRYAMMPEGYTEPLGRPAPGRALGLNVRYSF